MQSVDSLYRTKIENFIVDADLSAKQTEALAGLVNVLIVEVSETVTQQKEDLKKKIINLKAEMEDMDTQISMRDDENLELQDEVDNLRAQVEDLNQQLGKQND
ncbi:hypothetical protein FC41_GL000064 [Lactobacillus hominis DSM 23910 = CRBIP 24.179]|nr:hypothetical protein FC41_GL000064 [Lactobacillus hominis DSM 23910 = CRBIP 24.179]